MDFDNVDSRIGAANGTKRITGTSANTGLSISGIIPETDAAATKIDGETEQGETVDFTAAPYNWTALKAGIPYYTPMGMKITAITLTAGELATY